MRKLFIAVLCVCPLLANATPTKSDVLSSRLDMIDASQNFALVMGDRIPAATSNPATNQIKFAYDAADLMDQNVAKILNTGWTCDNLANSLNGNFDRILKNATGLTSIQVIALEKMRKSSIKYAYVKCYSLDGK